MLRSSVSHQFTCRANPPQTQSAFPYSLIVRTQPTLFPLKTVYIMQRMYKAEPIMTNTSLSTFWANSSVTLTEELLKPKWLVRVSCRTRCRWLFILHNIPRCSSSLSKGPDLVLTCGPPDGASVWGGKKQVPRWWCLIGGWGIGTEGGWGKQPRHLTINQGLQLWALRKTDCWKMDEARGKEENRREGGRQERGAPNLKRGSENIYLFIIVWLHLWHLWYLCTALVRSASQTEWCELVVFFSSLRPPANHPPVNTGTSHLHNSAQKVDNDVRSFFGRVQTWNVITAYNTCTLGLKVNTWTRFPALTWLLPVICFLLSM